MVYLFYVKRYVCFSLVRGVRLWIISRDLNDKGKRVAADMFTPEFFFVIEWHTIIIGLWYNSPDWSIVLKCRKYTRLIIETYPNAKKILTNFCNKDNNWDLDKSKGNDNITYLLVKR